MKKLLILAAALTIGAGAMAQEPTANPDGAQTEQSAPAKPEKKKKGGGFFNALKKGVESTTGLDVSKETLFVYPEIGQWKFAVVSSEGNPETGQVVVKINATALFDSPRYTGSRGLIKEAKVTKGNALELGRFSSDPLYDFVPNKPVEVTFQTIHGVPADAKTLDLKFYINMDIPKTAFEARDVPINWIKNE